jgi:hypothetical protein
MTDERWQQIVEMVQKNFPDASLSHEDLVMDSPEGPKVQGTKDVLEFENPGGRFRLERENKPAVLEKVEHYSHRMGDTARTEYKFSDTEMSHKLRVFKEDHYGEWEEVSLDKLGL